MSQLFVAAPLSPVASLVPLAIPHEFAYTRSMLNQNSSRSSHFFTALDGTERDFCGLVELRGLSSVSQRGGGCNRDALNVIIINAMRSLLPMFKNNAMMPMSLRCGTRSYADVCKRHA